MGVTEENMINYTDTIKPMSLLIQGGLPELQKYIETDEQALDLTGPISFVRIVRVTETWVRADFVAPCKDSIIPFDIKANMEENFNVNQAFGMTIDSYEVGKVKLPYNYRWTRLVMWVKNLTFHEDMRDQKNLKYKILDVDFKSALIQSLKERMAEVKAMHLKEIRCGINDTVEIDLEVLTAYVSSDANTAATVGAMATGLTVRGYDADFVESEESKFIGTLTTKDESYYIPEISFGEDDYDYYDDLVMEKPNYFFMITVPCFAGIGFVILFFCLCCTARGICYCTGNRYTSLD
ncbi:uncharacterized protein LOC143017640 [Oratosquilla oratoria]|uniref:uncharacterized protein LOC143017640 n=1 Tax=Oratosquilla oratoria TaxID=337810 RepID=UPI003F7635A7